MGGVFGEVRGRSKIETYLKYVEEVRDTVFETFIPNPENKKGCKAAMKWDPDTEEWVLAFHLHT